MNIDTIINNCFFIQCFVVFFWIIGRKGPTQQCPTPVLVHKELIHIGKELNGYLENSLSFGNVNRVNIGQDCLLWQGKITTHRPKCSCASSTRYVTPSNMWRRSTTKPLWPTWSRFTALDELEARWGQPYPVVILLWRRKWDNLSAYFRYPSDIRKVIYTTNAIESMHQQFRKLTKTKGVFSNENSLLTLLYLGLMNAQAKWTMPLQNWKLTLSQLAINFTDD